MELFAIGAIAAAGLAAIRGLERLYFGPQGR